MQNTLLEAQALIKDEAYDQARQMLRRALKQNPNDADGWWLYAKVAPNLDEACLALKNVLALNPDYPQAEAALKILNRRRQEQPAGG
jgi:cytochrome c-type biogenesis protein CcmH/NrfG